jgi:hypothetical protein
MKYSNISKQVLNDYRNIIMDLNHRQSKVISALEQDINEYLSHCKNDIDSNSWLDCFDVMSNGLTFEFDMIEFKAIFDFNAENHMFN